MPSQLGFIAKSGVPGYYRAITIDHTKVHNTDQDSIPIVWRSPVGTVNTVGTAVTLATGDGFPTWMTDSIMINGVVYKVSSITTSAALVLTSSAGTQSAVAYNGTPWLRHTSFGGKVTDLQGDDIKFATNSAGTTLLYWEIEKYDSSTGVTVAWSNIPSLSHTSDYVYYIRYGGTETTFQGDVNKTWSNSYVMVHHMNQAKSAVSQTITDATRNHNDLTNNGSPWNTSQTAAAVVGDGTSLVFANFQDFTFTAIALSGSYTTEGWINITAATYESIFLGHSSTSEDINWFAAKYRQYDGGAPVGDEIVAATSTSTGTWYHYVITRSGTSMVLYLNGTSDATSSNGNGSRVFDRMGASNSAFSKDISFDEIRIMSAVIADRPTVDYNNQSAPNTFQSTGSQN